MMYLWVKNAQWKSKYLKGVQCLCSNPGYSIPAPVVSDCVRHHPQQNIHPTPHPWPLWHSQSFLQGINPNQPPWLWFNNRVIVHNCLDFALLFQCFCTFHRPVYRVKHAIHLQTSFKQTPHLAKQKSRRGPRFKCVLQQCQELPLPERGQYCLRTGIRDPAKPPRGTDSPDRFNHTLDHTQPSLLATDLGSSSSNSATRLQGRDSLPGP